MATRWYFSFTVVSTPASSISGRRRSTWIIHALSFPLDHEIRHFCIVNARLSRRHETKHEGHESFLQKQWLSCPSCVSSCLRDSLSMALPLKLWMERGGYPLRGSDDARTGDDEF